VAEGVPPELVSHKIFEGNRPSTQILIGEMTPFTVRVPCPFSFTKLAVQHGGLRVSLFETCALSQQLLRRFHWMHRRLANSWVSTSTGQLFKDSYGESTRLTSGERMLSSPVLLGCQEIRYHPCIIFRTLHRGSHFSIQCRQGLNQHSHCIWWCFCVPVGRGVELGKVLAKACRATIDGSRKGTDASADALKGAGFTSATANLMAKFLADDA
jgi:hypothetical protein